MPRRSAHCAPVAQLDRALPSEGRGRRFESCRVRQSLQSFMCALGRTLGLKGAVRARALTQLLGSREAYAKCFTKSAQSPATDRRDRLSRYIYIGVTRVVQLCTTVLLFFQFCSYAGVRLLAGSNARASSLNLVRYEVPRTTPGRPKPRFDILGAETTQSAIIREPNAQSVNSASMTIAIAMNALAGAGLQCLARPRPRASPRSFRSR